MGIIRYFRFIASLLGLILGGGGTFFIIANANEDNKFFREVLLKNPGMDMPLSIIISIIGYMFLIAGIAMFIIYFLNKDMYWLRKYCLDAGDYASLSFLSSLSKRTSNPNGYYDSVSKNGIQLYNHSHHMHHAMCVYNPKVKSAKILGKLYPDNRQVVIELSNTPLLINIGYLNRDGSSRKYGVGIMISLSYIAILDHEGEFNQEELGEGAKYSREMIKTCKKNPEAVFTPHQGVFKLVIENDNYVKIDPTYAYAKNLVNEMEKNKYCKPLFDKLDAAFSKQPKQINDYYKTISECLKI